MPWQRLRKNDMDGNRETYRAPSIVQYYTELQELQPAEAAILKRFQDQLPSMTVLDLGIGGGRTTRHIAPQVHAYVGLDYSPEMVKVCQQTFADISAISSLAVADARDLSQFPDHSFDFIVFSFNGIDYVEHGDRHAILQEIHRVGKPGAYFLFSSHNLQGIAKTFRYRTHLSWNPLSTYVNLVMFGFLRLCNRSITCRDINGANHLMIRDESHNFRLRTYYVRPEHQIKALEPYFQMIDVYPWNHHHPIASPEALAANTEMWLYYLCVVNSSSGIVESDSR